MLIRYGFRLGFDVPQPTCVLARLDVHPSRRSDVLSETQLRFGGEEAPAAILDVHGNLCRRLIAPPGRSLLEMSGVIRDSGTHEDQMTDEPLCAVGDLPDEALVYLLASRYCETDQIGNLAWQLFGHLPSDARRVRAVVDFVHDHLTFGYRFARPTRTAQEALSEGVGVCRDFAHLTIALCRALNIPARYVNGYLGDIGVPPDPAAMDFSAWVEVFVGGRWFTVDARHNMPRIGRIVLARGRDAADVPLVHSFGPHALQEFTVVTEEIPMSKAPPAVLAQIAA
jgi:transglutaminase-like putative cysteine protease